MSAFALEAVGTSGTGVTSGCELSERALETKLWPSTRTVHTGLPSPLSGRRVHFLLLEFSIICACWMTKLMLVELVNSLTCTLPCLALGADECSARAQLCEREL